MLKTLRYATALLLLIWLGVVITITFYVAPSLFANESGQIPNSTVAADIIGPLLDKMDLTGWIILPVVILLHGVMALLFRPRFMRALIVSASLLAVAWGTSLYVGVGLNPELHSIRTELKKEFGGYHLAADDHPQRARFAKLHGVAMVLTLVNLCLGLGSLFCVTQLFDADGASHSAAPEPAPGQA